MDATDRICMVYWHYARVNNGLCLSLWDVFIGEDVAILRGWARLRVRGPEEDEGECVGHEDRLVLWREECSLRTSGFFV